MSWSDIRALAAIKKDQIEKKRDEDMFQDWLDRNKVDED